MVDDKVKGGNNIMYTFALWTTLVDVYIILLPPFILQMQLCLDSNAPSYNLHTCLQFVPFDLLNYIKFRFAHTNPKYGKMERPFPSD